MKLINVDDPQLTAYALGELHGEEAAAIEAQIAQNESLRRAVEEVQATAQMLRAEFAAEQSPGLTPQQRERVEAGPQGSSLNHPLIFRSRSLWMAASVAAAACLTIVAFVTLMFDQRNASELVGHQLQNPPGASANDPANHEAKRQAVAKESNQLDSSPREMLAESEGRSQADKFATPKDQVAATPSIDAVSEDDWSGEGRTRSVMPQSSSTPPPPSARRSGGGRSGSSIGRLERSARSESPPAQATAEPGAGLGVDRGLAASGADLEQSHSNAPTAASGNRENYAAFSDNPFLIASEQPLSSFSVDPDTASYTNIRRLLDAGQAPPRDAVRIEELVNYFKFSYEPPTGDAPFAAHVEVSAAPWKPEHSLVRIGLQGRHVPSDMRPPTSLVFLIDVSGSMNQPTKLPLVKQSLAMLVKELTPDDRLGIVTYAGHSGIAMDPTYCTHAKKPEILKIINDLQAGGSTNGEGGIRVAYDLAARHFITDGVNRVILCTDGDFNVGVSSEDELQQLISEMRTTGVYLSVLGFGSGNLQDAKMKQLAMHGNGNYAFIDGIDEGKRALVDHLSGTLVPIAKDVKVQIEFNPAKVHQYRLIGYENRIMTAEDFANQRKDAGEIGAGHSVTAMYEVVPMSAGVPAGESGETAAAVQPAQQWRDDLLTVRLRYKQPHGEESLPLEFRVQDQPRQWDQASADFKFAAAVAAFGMILRESPHSGDATFPKVLDWAEQGLAGDPDGQRSGFIRLVQQAQVILARRQDAPAVNE